MTSQEFIFGTEHRSDGFYALIQWPLDEGGSLEQAGPFPTLQEAEQKLENGISLLKALIPEKIKHVHPASKESR